MTEDREKAYCDDYNEWLYSDGCDCCPHHMKDGEYHHLDKKKFAKLFYDLNYLKIREDKRRLNHG